MFITPTYNYLHRSSKYYDKYSYNILYFDYLIFFPETRNSALGKKVSGYKVDNRSAVTEGMESTYATMLNPKSWLAIDVEVTEHIDRVVIVLAAGMVSYIMFLF